MEKTLLMKLLKYEIPEQYENKNDVLLCHYCTGWFAGLAIFSVVCGAPLPIGMFVGVLSAKPSADVVICFMLLALFVAFLMVGGIFVLYMKNAAVIFHANGIWHRKLNSKSREIKDEEIMECWISDCGRHAHIAIKTAYGMVYIGRDSKGYRTAKEWVRRKYKCI